MKIAFDADVLAKHMSINDRFKSIRCSSGSTGRNNAGR